MNILAMLSNPLYMLKLLFTMSEQEKFPIFDEYDEYEGKPTFEVNLHEELEMEESLLIAH